MRNLILFILLINIGCSNIKFTEIPPINIELELTQPIIDEIDPLPNNNDNRDNTPQRTISFNKILDSGTKDVDFLLILDDSSSMLEDLKKLAQRLDLFIQSIENENIDWQMCLTTTRGSQQGPNKEFGKLVQWKNQNHSFVINKNTQNLDLIFEHTIQQLPIGGGFSGDERGIKAAYQHFQKYLNGENMENCFRQNSILAYILISDEDEASVAGQADRLKPSDSATALQPLTKEDDPIEFDLLLKSNERIYTFNSIIVRPNDIQCEKQQDLEVSPSHSGNFYAQLSHLSLGGIGNICDQDYWKSLIEFKNVILRSTQQLMLECQPNPKTIDLRINQAPNIHYQVQNDVLRFDQAISDGSTIELKYQCQQ